MGTRIAKKIRIISDDSLNTVAAQDEGIAVGRNANYTDTDLNQGGLNTGIIAQNSTINASLDPYTSRFLSDNVNSVNDIIKAQTSSFENSFNNLLDYASGIKTPAGSAIGLNVKENPAWLIAGVIALFLFMRRR